MQLGSYCTRLHLRSVTVHHRSMTQGAEFDVGTLTRAIVCTTSKNDKKKDRKPTSYRPIGDRRDSSDNTSATANRAPNTAIHRAAENGLRKDSGSAFG